MASTLVTATVLTGGAAAEPSSAAPSPTELVDSLHAVFGRHAGARASHAKGFCAQAIFEPSPQARQFSKARLFNEVALPATVRWSIGGGNPNVSDKSRSVRGLSMRLHGPEETYDLLMLSEPVFFAATPESFVSFLQARVPDPTTKKPDPEKIKAHDARFPEGKRQPALLAAHAAPASYATTPYFSNHAFRFVNAAGQGTWARLVAEPAAGTVYLSPEAEASAPDTFLEDELKTRLQAGPVDFTFYAQPAADGDSLTDPSQPWSENGPAKVVLGRLRVQALSAAENCDGLVFIPTQLPAGIEPADDPILKARAAAYAVSAQRRKR